MFQYQKVNKKANKKASDTSENINVYKKRQYTFLRINNLTMLINL